MRDRSGKPIARINLPAHPPAKIAAVAEAFEDVANRWAVLVGQHREAQAEIEAAKAKDVEVNAEAFLAGKTPKVMDKHEQAAVAKEKGLRAALVAAGAAVDSAGSRLIRAIPEAREEWLVDLRKREAKALERYRAALDEARDALAEFAPLHGGVVYLESFDVGLTMGHREPLFHGRGKVTVEGDELGQFGGDLEPSDLLRLAAKVGQPTRKEQRAMAKEAAA
jgi:hypothetical protein